MSWGTLVASLTVLLAVHIGLTYLASERLNVFTALCMLSMLPATAAGLALGGIARYFWQDADYARLVGFVSFLMLVLPYTGQALWEILKSGKVDQNRQHER